MIFILRQSLMSLLREDMLKNKIKAQIATILTLIMAVIFLFIVITINIGNIAQEKTMVSNASDGAALLLASMLGSLANALRIKLELWGNRQENCEFDVYLIVAIFSLAAAIALTIASLGAGTPAIVMALINLGLQLTFFSLGMWNALKAEPGVFRQIELKFQNMTLEQRMKEKAIQYAFFAVVNDPNKVCANNKVGGGDPKECGGCSDPNDLDMDGDTTDCIHWFSKWYDDRLKALPRMGEIVQNFYEQTFSRDILGQKTPRIYVWENPRNWKPYENQYGFWIDTWGRPNQPDPMQGSLRLAIRSDIQYDPQGVVYANDIYFVDWLEQRFEPLVENLYLYGYGISADLNETLTQIRNLRDEIKDIETELSELYGATFESRLESFDEWIKLFYNGTTDKQDWYKRMGNWLTIVESWILTLRVRTQQINDDLYKCWSPGPWVCGAGGGECCISQCVPCPPPEDIGPPDTGLPPDVGGGGEGGEGEGGEGGGGEAAGAVAFSRFGKGLGEELINTQFAQGGCECGCECVSACGCAPAGRYYGQLCPSSRCRPRIPLYTPTGGVRQCCDSVYYLHYQLCPATREYGGGGGGPCDGPCYDTYHNCEYDSRLNHITREHTIDYLTQFVNDVRVLREVFVKAYTDAQNKEMDPRFYEVLYEWDDKIAKGEMGEQKVHHIAYVKLSDNLKPNKDNPEKGFQVPYIHNYREWFPLPRKCANVEREKGDFTITVARYDQDVGGEKSPLRNLWIFKSRKKPAEKELSVPGPGYTDPAADPATYRAKADFVLDNGIVSETEGNYGPGWTYTKEELEKWGTEAARRNKDIYIKRRK